MPPSPETPRRSIAADIAFACAVLGAALLAFGPLSSYLGVLSPLLGFSLAAISLPLALLALAMGIAGVVRTRESAGRRGRARAWAGVGYGVSMFAVLGALAAMTPRTARINDITTDAVDPPRFIAALLAPENAGRDYAYTAAFAAEQLSAYPDVRPIFLDAPPPLAFERALGAAKKQGFRIVAVNAGMGHIEAMAVSRVFRFVDDIVVRVRPRGGGSIVDIRSKSRDGRGDMGVNAARIRVFAEALRSPSS